MGVDERSYRRVGEVLAERLANPAVKNREAIQTAFRLALSDCPDANASDLWHHVVYRQYCEILPQHRPKNPNQSWVRASGDALEGTVEQIYAPILRDHGVGIVALISRNQKRIALREMALKANVGESKLDVALYLLDGERRRIFGGVHVKASLAERVSDDIPASRAMMADGYFSPLWTLDVKSFPPPAGDLVNRGELGSPSAPSDKRRYVEDDGDFDNCYTGNSRSVESDGETQSGKRIVKIRLSQQPDDFARDVVRKADTFRNQ